MQTAKSTRHSKITGDFGEALILYWLSRDGFECVRVDHTGIDIIARNPHTQELIGISVKSRSRNEGRESTALSISKAGIGKAEEACQVFDCVPYFAIVVDAGDKIRAFLLPVDRLLKLHPKGKTSCGWKMTNKHLDRYAADRTIKAFDFTSRTTNWWKEAETSA